ncbi:hypothetical protein OROGR_008719 [Orobanche gracilis]
MAELCSCGKEIDFRTSWSDANPGRKYKACKKFRRPDGCLFFVWLDPPCCSRCPDIIPGLLRKLDRKEIELAEKEERIRVMMEELKLKDTVVDELNLKECELEMKELEIV